MPPRGTLRVIDAAEDFAVDVNQCFSRRSRRRTYGQQIRRSAGSVSSNLIEGYDRGPGPDRRYRYNTARCECEETLGWLRKSRRIGELNRSDFFRLSNRGVTIIRMIDGLDY